MSCRRPPLSIREAVAAVAARGHDADIDLDGAHLKVRWLGHNGRQHLLVLSRSRSDRRTALNSRAVLRRLLREGERPAMTAIPYVARCSVCGARPFVDPTGFTLKRLDSSGRPTSRSEGELFCESHYPPRTDGSRSPMQTPLKALDQFERKFTDLTAGFATAVIVDGPDDDALSDASGTFGADRDEVRRFLTELRTALEAWEPKLEPKPKRKPLSLASDHPDQGDLADETRKRGEDAA
jgi:hypothetical protein